MPLETAIVISHEPVLNDYRILSLKAPAIAVLAKPGQFVHLRVPKLESAILRRPFSIFKANYDSISILYKRVGAGTRAMTSLSNGDSLNLMGPLGNGFPSVRPGCFPVLIGGGYGAAALRLLAERSSSKGVAFLGASCAQDILCMDEFKNLGWDVRTATDDGSSGRRGLITEALDDWLASELAEREPEFFACGPIGMLRSLAERAIKGGWMAWLSMERHMGCGVGACLGCAQKVKHSDSADKETVCGEHGQDWEFARVCLEGPVFECRKLIWE